MFPQQGTSPQSRAAVVEPRASLSHSSGANARTIFRRTGSTGALLLPPTEAGQVRLDARAPPSLHRNSGRGLRRAGLQRLPKAAEGVTGYTSHRRHVRHLNITPGDRLQARGRRRRGPRATLRIRGRRRPRPRGHPGPSVTEAGAPPPATPHAPGLPPRRPGAPDLPPRA